MMQRGKKTLKNKQRLSELWENFRQPNICVIGDPEVGGQKKIVKYIYIYLKK